MKTRKSKLVSGSGTKSVGSGIGARIIYEAICNRGGCYADATSNYGFCKQHMIGNKMDKDGVWIHNEG